MREATEPAEAGGGFFEIETGEGVGIGAVRPHAKAFEKGAADQMRRLSGHRADPEIDAGLAKIHGLQLRMGVGHVQDAGIAEAFEIVDAWRIGAAREPRQARGERGGAREGDKFPAADGHAISPRQTTVIARSASAKQSSFAAIKLDCFAALAMTISN